MEIKANNPIKIGKLLNFRDLGGYINKDGIKLKKGYIYRSDNLSELTKEDVDQFVKNEITTIIDFRLEKEKFGSHAFNNEKFHFYEIPMTGNLDYSDPENMMFKGYLNILENKSNELLKALEVISKAKKGLVYHCSAGKDRTGILSMLILSIVNVSDEQIIEDYKSSCDNNKPNEELRRKRLMLQGNQKVPNEIFLSREIDIKRTLEYLKENYGDAQNYLVTKGLNQEIINSIKTKLLED